MQPAHRSPSSPAEYLARERASDRKHELVHGEIVAMAGASPAHNLVAANIASALRGMLAAKPSVVLSSDQRIHVPATGLFTYPDVTVVCGRPELHRDDDQTLTNPCVLVEVLSDSTEAYDRGAKFRHYQSIPALEEYVLVASKEKRVEHYRRQDGQRWLLTVYGEDALEVAFPSLGGAIAFQDVYAKWETFATAGA